MEDPRLPPPAVELHVGGLAPVFPGSKGAGLASATATIDPREALRCEEESHRRSCLSREAGWEAEVFEAMTTADAVKERSRELELVERARAREKGGGGGKEGESNQS